MKTRSLNHVPRLHMLALAVTAAVIWFLALTRASAAPNQAPVARNDSFTVNEDLVLTVAAPGVLANDSDVNQDPLTATLLAAPGSGSLAFNPNGSFTYTPIANFNGSVSFTYQANDGRLNSAITTVTITVIPVNDPPVARPDSFSIDEDRSLQAVPGVLANDFDVEFEQQRGGQMTASVIRQPSAGTLTLNSDGTFLYRPRANFNGVDSFDYSGSDGVALSAPARVTITVRPVPDVPVAQNLSIKMPEGEPVAVTLRGGDGDGDALTFRVETPPRRGALSGTLPFLTYTPSPLNPEATTDSFTYTVSDGVLRSPAATVTIEELPVIRMSNMSISEGSTFLCGPDFTFKQVPFEIRLSAPSSKEVSVQFRLLNGTAIVNSEVHILPSFDGLTPFTVTFAPRETSITLTNIHILRDCRCEADEIFGVQLSSPVNALIDDEPAIVTILNDDICIGTATLIPSESSARVGERLNYGLVWTHPEQWRLLETMDLRISDDHGAIIQVRWHEPSNTFSLVESDSGALGRAATPGSSAQLQTAAATLHLAATEVVGSGPEGQSVLLILSLSFKPQAAGRTYQVEAFATDDFGHEQVEPVGTLTVLEK